MNSLQSIALPYAQCMFAYDLKRNQERFVFNLIPFDMFLERKMTWLTKKKCLFAVESFQYFPHSQIISDILRKRTISLSSLLPEGVWIIHPHSHNSQGAAYCFYRSNIKFYDSYSQPVGRGPLVGFRASLNGQHRQWYCQMFVLTLLLLSLLLWFTQIVTKNSQKQNSNS